MLAMDVNDNACSLNARVVLAFFREHARSYRETSSIAIKSASRWQIKIRLYQRMK